MPILSPHIVGHEQTQSDLLHALTTNRLGQSWIFTGTAGIGKKQVALALAKALVCESPFDDGAACHNCRQCLLAAHGTHPDIQVFVRDKSQFSVEQMRESVLDWASRKPREGRRKIGIIDDVEHLNQAAANAFLKTLEEPPLGTYWLLLTSDASGTLPTILSRCRRMTFEPLPRQKLETLLGGPLAPSVALALKERDERWESETSSNDEESGDDDDGSTSAVSLMPGERAFLLSFAAGSPGRVIELVRDGAMSVRDLMLDAMLSRPLQSPIASVKPDAAGPLDAADLLMAIITRKDDETQEPLRARLRLAISLAQSLLRDAMALLMVEKPGLANQDKRPLIERALPAIQQKGPDALESLFLRLEELRENLGRNASAKTISAMLMLEIHGLLSVDAKSQDAALRR